MAAGSRRKSQAGPLCVLHLDHDRRVVGFERQEHRDCEAEDTTNLLEYLVEHEGDASLLGRDRTQRSVYLWREIY